MLKKYDFIHSFIHSFIHITPNTLLKHHHVSSSLLFIYPMPAYYRYLTKMHDGQPFYLRLSEWTTALDTPLLSPTIKWCGVEKLGILSEYRYSESIPNFSTPYHLMVGGVCSLSLTQVESWFILAPSNPTWLFRVFGRWTCDTQFLWIALIHQVQ